MMGLVFWVFKRVILTCVYIAIQYSLYQRTVGYFNRSAGDDRWARRRAAWAKAFFIGINLPILLHLSPYVRMSLPKAIAVVTIYPFDIWLPSSAIIFFLL